MMNDSIPKVSFCFDDVPSSALQQGCPILKSKGVVGSIFVSGGFLGSLYQEDELVQVIRDGHEVCDHTFSHQRFEHLPEDELRADLERNRVFLQRFVDLKEVASFAFPYGSSRPELSEIAVGYYARVRDGSRGVGRLGARLIPSLKLYGTEAQLEDVDRILDGLREGDHAVFYTHDVVDVPSRFGCTPGLLEGAVDGALRRGLDVVALGQPAREARPLRG